MEMFFVGMLVGWVSLFFFVGLIQIKPKRGGAVRVPGGIVMTECDEPVQVIPLKMFSPPPPPPRSTAPPPQIVILVKGEIVVDTMNRWKALFHLCWLFGHDHQSIVDCDARKSLQRCGRCGHSFQYDWEAVLSPDWIGFCDDAHRCPLCMGWKPRNWERCGNEVCELNPNGPPHLMPDGSARHLLDGPRQSLER